MIGHNTTATRLTSHKNTATVAQSWSRRGARFGPCMLSKGEFSWDKYMQEHGRIGSEPDLLYPRLASRDMKTTEDEGNMDFKHLNSKISCRSSMHGKAVSIFTLCFLMFSSAFAERPAEPGARSGEHVIITRLREAGSVTTQVSEIMSWSQYVDTYFGGDDPMTDADFGTLDIHDGLQEIIPTPPPPPSIIGTNPGDTVILRTETVFEDKQYKRETIYERNLDGWNRISDIVKVTNCGGACFLFDEGPPTFEP